jgi:hypothetical protein
MAHRDRFGRDKASQRRQKIKQPADPLPTFIVLKRGDAVRWEGHQGIVQRIADDTADIAEDSTGRVWRLPITTLTPVMRA